MGFGVVLVVGILIKAGIYTTMPISLNFMFSLGIMATIWLGVSIDRKARIKRMLREFQSLGFVSQDPSSLDHDILLALDFMEPHAFPASSIRFAAHGVLDEQEVILFELFTEVDDHPTTFTGCAAWVADDLPQAVIRRRTFKDKFSRHTQLGDPKFDKQRVFISNESEYAADLLLRHSDWFITNKNQISSFRMRQPPGKVEQWAFLGHWILLVDQGSAYTKQHLAMAHFLIAFANALESNLTEAGCHYSPGGPRVPETSQQRGIPAP